MEEVTLQSEAQISQLRKKSNDAQAELADQIDNLQKTKAK